MHLLQWFALWGVVAMIFLVGILRPRSVRADSRAAHYSRGHLAGSHRDPSGPGGIAA